MVHAEGKLEICFTWRGVKDAFCRALKQTKTTTRKWFEVRNLRKLCQNATSTHESKEMKQPQAQAGHGARGQRRLQAQCHSGGGCQEDEQARGGGAAPIPWLSWGWVRVLEPWGLLQPWLCEPCACITPLHPTPAPGPRGQGPGPWPWGGP